MELRVSRIPLYSSIPYSSQRYVYYILRSVYVFAPQKWPVYLVNISDYLNSSQLCNETSDVWCRHREEQEGAIYLDLLCGFLHGINALMGGGGVCVQGMWCGMWMFYACSLLQGFLPSECA